MTYEEKFDYRIPRNFRGKPIIFFNHGTRVNLNIPSEAHFLDVNPLEDGEEFLGNQGDCGRQEIIYYDQKGRYISCEDLEHLITTDKLMNSLDGFLQKCR